MFCTILFVRKDKQYMEHYFREKDLGRGGKSCWSFHHAYRAIVICRDLFSSKWVVWAGGHPVLSDTGVGYLLFPTAKSAAVWVFEHGGVK